MLESLIKCGALDSLRVPRARLCAGLDELIRWGEQEANGGGQMGLACRAAQYDCHAAQ